MANLLKPRSASSNPSYEGFDLSHKFDFTSSVGHMIPVYYDLLLPGDKVDIRCEMLSIIPKLVAPSPIILDEMIDYYFVPLECLYTIFPALLSDTNEDLNSTLYNKNFLQDKIPMFQSRSFLDRVCTYDDRDLKDTFGFDLFRRGAWRLAHALRNYGWYTSAGEFAAADSVGLNLLTLLAYQAVWQFYFRDDKRITFDNRAFNVDRFYNQVGTPINDNDLFMKAFEIRYHPWKKDSFMITSPSPLGGQTSLNHFATASGTDEQRNFASFVQQWLSNDDNIGIATEYKYGIANQNGDYPATTDKDNYTDTVFPNRTNASTVQQSLQQHRIAQAIEKLSAVWMQSGKSYQDMMNNLFGVKTHPDTSKPQYLGSDSNKVFINELIANIGTDQTEIGEMTGYGKGSNSHEVFKDGFNSVKFTAPCHGIVIGIYSAVPDSYYSSFGVDPINTYRQRSSFPWPQTDELGEQPLFNYETYVPDDTGDYSVLMSQIKGWLPRFHELKLKANRVCMGFDYGASLSYWIPKRGKNGDLDALILKMHTKDFYVSPDYLNTILIDNYGATIVDAPEYYNRRYFDSDPLLHFFNFHSHKASKMSSYGVPSTYFG